LHSSSTSEFSGNQDALRNTRINANATSSAVLTKVGRNQGKQSLASKAQSSISSEVKNGTRNKQKVRAYAKSSGTVKQGNKHSRFASSTATTSKGSSSVSSGNIKKGHCAANASASASVFCNEMNQSTSKATAHVNTDIYDFPDDTVDSSNSNESDKDPDYVDLQSESSTDDDSDVFASDTEDDGEKILCLSFFPLSETHYRN
jgi:hypothetical protein